MYRLLIVDDEQVIRQKLSGFPWEENGIRVTGILKNSIKAEAWTNSNDTDIQFN